MAEIIRAVIFDMDGVLVESEHLWRKAMIEGFSEVGIVATENDCRKTMGMRIGDVINLWLRDAGKPLEGATVLEDRIITLLLSLIEREAQPIAGIPDLIDFCREKKLRTGLATSSSNRLMNAVLQKINMRHLIDVAVSAENLKYAKPHPEVFLNCADQLGVLPQECIVIEDSLNGVIAGRAANMQVIAVPDDEHLRSDENRARQFVLAHHHFNNMREVLAFFKSRFAWA